MKIRKIGGLDYTLKIGLIPERRYLADAATRKGIFAPKYAIENKNEIIKYIKDNFTDEKTTFTDLEWLNEEGLLSDNGDVDIVKEYLVKEKVDAIFVINCNFGNEEAAGQIAKKICPERTMSFDRNYRWLDGHLKTIGYTYTVTA